MHRLIDAVASPRPSFLCLSQERGDWELQSLLTLISVLVTEIKQRRVCGAENVLSAQGLGLAGSL
ncbi:hypothetical protein GOB91_15260 [Sinorhizobium meliloti]|nr:hypothetical protein CDO23_07515 [Sinorhizobium meliloti]MDW9409229.1 hypothetical protein [Sinorhizobium meliloti]MDW9442222.1 hypothetical protein [Sinorhizobium meliloti]MDW9454385.1 hypothetical protein [Sinorhizobium meliloti]MDW9468246.1 hypothetical protein [Sinorhizobium meliloti]